MSTDRKPPIQSFRHSTIKVNLWEKETKAGKLYAMASLEKSYRDQSGAWRQSRSFSQDDLVKLQPLLDEAQKSMKKWREYYNEVENNPDLPNPVQQQEMQQEQASHQQTQGQDMAAQRDAVMAQSQPTGQSQGHEHVQTHEPSR